MKVPDGEGQQGDRLQTSRWYTGGRGRSGGKQHRQGFIEKRGEEGEEPLALIIIETSISRVQLT